MKNIIKIGDYLRNSVNNDYRWERDETKTVSNLPSITQSEQHSTIAVDCHEFLISTQVMKKYLDLGYDENLIINQICEWIHERINGICNEILNKSRGKCINFEVIYRWNNHIIMSSKY